MTLKQFITEKILCSQYEYASHLDNIFSLFNKWLMDYSPRNILDVGCASGERTIRIANFFNTDMNRVHGLDYNDERIEECQKKFNAERIDLEVDSLPYDEKRFDLVICNQVLEHLKNYNRAIDELIRVTKMSGYIIIGIPNLAHLINRLYLLAGIQPMCINIDGPHVRSFTHKAFKNKLISLPKVKLIDFEGGLMYPFPFPIGKFFAKHFTGLSGYVCYLLQKDTSL